jgi:hypothetical protein
MNPRPPALHPSIVLSAYLEPLIKSRRVAILGDATIGLADELSQRGARLLHVYDPDAARVAEALARAARPSGTARPHPIAYAVLAGDLGVRDGAFDVVIVPDLSLFDDAADAMRRARRLVPPSGIAVFVAPNAGGVARRLLPESRTGVRPSTLGADGKAVGPLGYYELFDLVSLQFAKVRMIGQAPFVGYTVADFAPSGEPEVSVDTSLLASSEEPEHFLAIGSDRPVVLDSYAVIELPWHDVAEAVAPDTLPARTAEKLALADADARVASLGAEVERLVAQAAAREALQAGELARGAAALGARVAELEGEVLGRDARLKEIEGRAGDSHVRAERLTNQIRDLDEELRRQRDRGTKLSKLLDDEKKARTKAELELGMVRGKPEIAGAKDRIDALTTDLDLARTRVAELELDLTETRRRLTLPPAPPAPDAKLIHRLNELEQAVNAALHDAAETAAERDAAQSRALQAEAHLARVAALEAQLAAEQRDRADLDERAGTAEKRAAESARRFTEVERHAAEAARRADALALRLAQAERRLADADQLATEREARLADQGARVAALEADAAGRSSSAARTAEEAAEAAALEIASLEAALRERGHVITALTRDLRESERVGKELVGELDAHRGWGANGSPGHDGGYPQPPGDDLRSRLDALAAGAARSEADLQAATWRIAQLERELEEARRAHRPEGQPTSVQIELEQALAAARDEVASLRRALGATAS